ncbi:MAG: hypothetical protein JXQ68_07740 [Campylobacterales bacterium]|nr:hypothetical protein [Campylobacterales bacterium]
MELITFFGYSTLIHFTILLIWFGLFVFAKEWMYTLHSQWFDIPKEQFDTIHYKLMAFYKLFILTTAFVPYLTLLIIK